MTFLIQEQICVYKFFLVVWGFSRGWEWNVIIICKFCTAVPKKKKRNFYIPPFCYLLKKYANAENKGNCIFSLYTYLSSPLWTIHSHVLVDVWARVISVVLQFSVIWFCEWILLLQLQLSLVGFSFFVCLGFCCFVFFFTGQISRYRNARKNTVCQQSLFEIQMYVNNNIEHALSNIHIKLSNCV